MTPPTSPSVSAAAQRSGRRRGTTRAAPAGAPAGREEKRQYYEACGKRKTAVARVRLYLDGAGTVHVNGRTLEEYFPRNLHAGVLAPLDLVHLRKIFDVSVHLRGGGSHGQADAMRHGVSKALLLHDPELRTTLKRQGFLRRDPRIKERKKPGLRRARRAPQFAKR